MQVEDEKGNNVVVGGFEQLDPEHAEVKKLLVAANGVEGDGVLSEYEEKFVSDAYRQFKKFGNKFDLSEKRMDVLNTVRKKLEKEGML